MDWSSSPGRAGEPARAHPRVTEEERRDWQKTRRLVQRAGVPAADVDDVAQEVMLAIARSAASFRILDGRTRADAWSAWCFGVLRKLVASYMRERAREAAEKRHASGLEGASLSPEDERIRRDALDDAAQVLAALSPKRRAVFLAYELEGAEMRDIAQEVDVPLNTAWNLLRVARQHVRARVERIRARQRAAQARLRLAPHKPASAAPGGAPPKPAAAPAKPAAATKPKTSAAPTSTGIDLPFGPRPLPPDK